MCLLEGMVLSPDMSGYCTTSCEEYLYVCVPRISMGMLVSCECCGNDYCSECDLYSECQG